MKRKIFLFMILLFILGIILYSKISQKRNLLSYSDKHITRKEVKEELSFSVYKDMDWDNIFQNEKHNLTIADARQILEKTGLGSDVVLPDKKSFQIVSRQEWNGIYLQILDFLDNDLSVKQKTILVLDFIEKDEGCILITEDGEYVTPLPRSYFAAWQAYTVFLNKTDCLGIAGISDDEIVLPNTYLTKSQNKQLSFLFQGTNYTLETDHIPEDLHYGVADLVFCKRKLTGIRVKQDKIEGNLLSYDDVLIEIEGYGRLKHIGKLPVYKKSGDVVTEVSLSDVVLGNQNVSYVIGEKEVCAILIEDAVNIQNIRVLLLNESGGIYHTNLYLKSDDVLTVSLGQQQYTYQAGELVSISDLLTDEETTLTVNTASVCSAIYICNADQSDCSNGYEGSMEVRKYPEGYTIVNSLLLEHYLYAVVPSEMPSSYEIEALKAQAVCARSYAYIQLMRADLAAYGAHVNDSTSYQVYNKTAPTDAAIRAVDETAGCVVTFQGKPVETFYFSTSMGYTDTTEVWNVAETAEYPYLKQTCLDLKTQQADLSDETDFLSYIKNSFPGYDSDVPYYRWNADVDYSGKEDMICKILADRHSISPRNVIYYESDGITECDSLPDMGRLQDISVKKRSKSGFILTLRLTFENGAADVSSEYNIRNVLACGIRKLTCQDGSDRTPVTLLPSAAFAIDKNPDGTYLFSGGGFGQGIGMSQNGANGLAKAGFSCKEIIDFFFDGTMIEKFNTSGYDMEE